MAITIATPRGFATYTNKYPRAAVGTRTDVSSSLNSTNPTFNSAVGAGKVADVFVFYEHHRDANQKIVLTEIKLSSSDKAFRIAFYHSRENLLFDLIKPLLKAPASSVRSYDEVTNVWSYKFGGEHVLQSIEAVTKALGGVSLVELPDLAEQATQGTINLSGRKSAKMKAEEFFYQHAVPNTSRILTKEQIEEKLTVLVGAVIDKTSYRRAALRYHPDRNNGDGSKMSELNMLWQLYNS